MLVYEKYSISLKKKKNEKCIIFKETRIGCCIDIIVVYIEEVEDSGNDTILRETNTAYGLCGAVFCEYISELERKKNNPTFTTAVVFVYIRTILLPHWNSFARALQNIRFDDRAYRNYYYYFLLFFNIFWHFQTTVRKPTDEQTENHHDGTRRNSRIIIGFGKKLNVYIILHIQYIVVFKIIFCTIFQIKSKTIDPFV